MPESLAQRGGKAGLVGVERGGEPAARAHHVADQLGFLGSHGPEPDRAGVAVEHRGDVDQVDRIVVHDAFALLHQLLDEMAQAELLGVGLGHGAAFRSDFRAIIGERIADGE